MVTARTREVFVCKQEHEHTTKEEAVECDRKTEEREEKEKVRLEVMRNYSVPIKMDIVSDGDEVYYIPNEEVFGILKEYKLNPRWDDQPEFKEAGFYKFYSYPKRTCSCCSPDDCYTLRFISEKYVNNYYDEEIKFLEAKLKRLQEKKKEAGENLIEKYKEKSREATQHNYSVVRYSKKNPEKGLDWGTEIKGGLSKYEAKKLRKEEREKAVQEFKAKPDYDRYSRFKGPYFIIERDFDEYGQYT